MNSENYANFLKFYELYKESSEISYEGRKIIFSCDDKAEKIKALEENFEIQDLGESNQFSLNLYEDKIRIFRDTHTFLKDFNEKRTSIDFAVILQDKSFLFFSHIDKKIFEIGSGKQIVESKNILIDNAIYFDKIIELIKDKLAIYNDDVKNELVMVSTSGREAFSIGYPKVQEELPEYNLKSIFYQLEEEISRKDFAPFFNNEICKILADKQVEERYVEFLKQHNLIVKSATLDFEIYLKDFSFEKIKTKFRENRDKYFQSLQDINSKFSSKLGSLVISISASIFATFRFKSEGRLFSGLLVLIAYTLYTWYSNYEIACSKNDLKTIDGNFKRELKEIYIKSPIIADSLEEDSNQINNKIKDILENLPILYLLVTGLNSLVSIFIIVETFKDMYIPAIIFSFVVACTQYCYFGQALFSNKE
jgi:hypothetical protein